MVLRIHLPNSINNNAFFVNNIGSAQRAFGHFTIHLLLAPGLVSFQDGQIGIGDEVEGEVIFGNKTLVLGGTVTTDT